jgi:hypothetical protein
MTYLKYINQLVTELKFKKAETLNMYEALLNEKGYLDTIETAVYYQHVNDCHVLANRAEQLMLGVLNGSLSAFDMID